MHVHLTSAGIEALPLLVAHGVTGVRDMGGIWDVVEGFRDLVETGEVAGPRIRTAGPIVENAQWLEAVRSIPEGGPYLEENPRMGVATPEDARAAVDSLARLGVDFVKVRNAPHREAYLALVKEADSRGLPVVGHLPGGGSGLPLMLDAGVVGLEHIDALAEELEGKTEAERRVLFDRMVERRVAYGPTLVPELARLYPKDAIRAVVEDTLGLLDPRRRYVSESLLEFWRLQQSLDKYDTPREWGPILGRGLDHLREMHESGVAILAGTDLGARLVYPGWSLHDELVLLVDRGGLTPLDALRAATLNPARFFGEADELGTVEVGKRADLVLLGGDPLVDIGEVRRVEAVILDGELYPRARLDELIAQAHRR